MVATRRPAVLDHPLVPKLMRLYSDAQVWVYRRTGGRLGGKWRIGATFPRGVPVLLLTTVGRKSGQPRTAPLIYLDDGSRLVLVASRSGMRTDPQWYLNVLKNADVEVQIGATVRRMRARQATAEERAGFWPRLVALNADLATYQTWTDRVIPVIVLEPLS